MGFGAAANLVHPATGYSVLRSLSEAPAVADTLAAGLKKQREAESEGAEVSSAVVAEAAWDTLWSAERRRQSSFQVREGMGSTGFDRVSIGSLKFNRADEGRAADRRPLPRAP
jgi:hypothetical protein